MINEFVDAWNKNKNKLEKHFRNTPQEQYDTYKKIIIELFKKVINPYLKKNEDELSYIFDNRF